ncbi:hypothetical protein D3C87_1199340 [compost metagenome]
MQRVAGGGQAVTVAWHIGDDAGARTTRRQQAKTGLQPTSTCGADDRRYTGQRHVVANVQIAADAYTAHFLGQAKTVDIDVIAIGEFIGGGADRVTQPCHTAHTGQASRIEDRLREDVRGLAIVGTQRSVQPLGRPFEHQSPVTLIVRGVVVPASNSRQRTVRSRQSGTAGMSQQE